MNIIMRLCRNRFVLLILSVFVLLMGTFAQAQDNYTKARQAMIKEIEADARITSFYINKKELDPKVMAAMSKVPRHEFVPWHERLSAYANRPLPIGHGQTISQPYIVALMTDLLKPERQQKVLEVGTGSGYQAAILAELVSEVFTIEIIEPLGNQAKERLKQLNYRNVTVRIGDGYYGWEEQGPFDGIVVTAASSHIPPPLIQQLKPGGRMVIPVGSRFMVQQLVLVEKDAKGNVTTRQILPVRFVPLTGKH
jgi:protein-L-isoaspartate(D-aspartate) O-methyltransferase